MTRLRQERIDEQNRGLQTEITNWHAINLRIMKWTNDKSNT